MRPALPAPFLKLPVAHRALHNLAAGRPENSRAAIRAAIASAMDKVSVEHNPYDVDGIDEAGNLGADPQIAEVVDGEVVLRKLSEITE